MINDKRIFIVNKMIKIELIKAYLIGLFYSI